ncbi:MAG: prepilin peptidase [Phycisphaeraceae bacterium]|nr:prepilin peptidase [Phycisphaeraceae bacterium]
MIGSAGLPPQWLLWQHAPALVFLFCFGACVGSFINVVIHRLPQGMSVIMPPSRCPVCGVRLRFFRENLPILGWLLIRGRCRACGTRVGPHYMAAELLCALLFVGLYLLLYLPPDAAWVRSIGGPWWLVNGFYRTWPAYFLLAFLFLSLAAVSIMDIRSCTIDISVPWFVVGCAAVLWPIQALLVGRPPAAQTWPVPAPGWSGVGLAIGMVLGLLVANVLLMLGRLRPSFADYDRYCTPDRPLAEYPHARREMGRELLYLGPIAAGASVGLALGSACATVPPVLLQAAALPWVGVFAAGAIVWGIRILGTLLFGREAMGLGDVHLMVAVGAVLGPWDPVLAFFIAPFIGLAWKGLSTAVDLLRRLSRRGRGARGPGGAGLGMARALPFGPHLAVASIAVVLARHPIERGLGQLNIPIPARGLAAPLRLVHRAAPAAPQEVGSPGTLAAPPAEGSVRGGAPAGVQGRRNTQG